MNNIHVSRLEPVTMQKMIIHLTHWGRDKMAAILQATLKKKPEHFLWKMFMF